MKDYQLKYKKVKKKFKKLPIGHFFDLPDGRRAEKINDKYARTISSPKNPQYLVEWEV